MGHRRLLVMQRHQLAGLMGLFSIAQSWAGGLRRLGAATVLDVSVAGVRVTNSWAARHSLRARYTGHSKVAPTLFG